MSGKVKRDSKGRFLKGNNEGVKFSETNPPKNAGRKPSRFKQILEGLSAIGETLSLEDYRKITATMLTLTKEELHKLGTNPATPMAVLLIANAIQGDAMNMRMDNLDKLLDRLFGKSTNNVDVTSKGDKVKGLTVQVLDEKIVDEVNKLSK